MRYLLINSNDHYKSILFSKSDQTLFRYRTLPRYSLTKFSLSAPKSTFLAQQMRKHNIKSIDRSRVYLLRKKWKRKTLEGTKNGGLAYVIRLGRGEKKKLQTGQTLTSWPTECVSLDYFQWVSPGINRSGVPLRAMGRRFHFRICLAVNFPVVRRYFKYVNADCTGRKTKTKVTDLFRWNPNLEF